MHKLKRIPWWAWVLTLKCVYVLLLLFFHPDAWQSTDAKGYLTLAKNLWEHGVFSRNTEAPYLFDTLRTPGYPLFIIVTGGLISPWLTILTQQVLHIVAAWFIYKTLKALNSNRPIALLTAILFAFDVPGFVFSTYLLSDTLVQTLLAAVIYVSVSFRQKHLFAVLLLIAATFVKPAVLYFLPLHFIWLGFQINVKKLSLLIVLTFLSIGSWQFRNYKHHDRWVFSTAGELNLCSWHAANVLAQKNQTDITTAQHQFWDSLYTNYSEGIPEENQVKYSKYIADESWGILKTHPYLTAKQTLENIALLWFKPLRSHLNQQWNIKTNHTTQTNKFTNNTWLAWLILALQGVFILLTYPTMIIGLKQIWQQHRKLFLLVALWLIYFSLMILPPTTYARFRMPLTPLIFVLVGLGFPTIFRFLKTQYARFFHSTKTH